MRGLRRAPVEVTLVDRQNFTLFQPLVYQVATGALSPSEIAAPLRAVVDRQRNARVLLAEVVGFDLERREVGRSDGVCRTSATTRSIVAGGSRYSYFGHDEWQEDAPELKSLGGALDIRSRILGAFEAAELEPDADRRRAWLTFVVVGGGPTGVEMAGQIAELARDTLRRDFRSVDTSTARVLLVEAGDRMLRAFPESLSRKATRALEQLGVTPLVGHTVVGVAAGRGRDPHAGGRRRASRGAHGGLGCRGHGLGARRRSSRARRGSTSTGPDGSTWARISRCPAIRRCSRSATWSTGPPARPFPAWRRSRCSRAGTSRARSASAARHARPFRYLDKGNLATIGRSKAVADVKGIRVAGFVAWALWLFVHLVYLIGFENRLLVLLRWTISFATRGRGARLIVSAHELPSTTGAVEERRAA